jgi:hypothetical protein
VRASTLEKYANILTQKRQEPDYPSTSIGFRTVLALLPQAAQPE